MGGEPHTDTVTIVKRSDFTTKRYWHNGLALATRCDLLLLIFMGEAQNQGSKSNRTRFNIAVFQVAFGLAITSSTVVPGSLFILFLGGDVRSAMGSTWFVRFLGSGKPNSVGRLVCAASLCIFMLASIVVPVLSQTLETPGKAMLQIVPSQAIETTEINILADRPIETYREFQLQSPPRLVIDIENARLQRNTHIDIDHAAVRNVRAASHPATARIVLDLALSEPVNYRITRRETGLLVSVWLQKNKAPANAAPAAATVIADPLPVTAAVASVPAAAVQSQTGGTTVSIDLAAADMRDFFAIIAAQSGIPIDVAPEIAMPISLRLMDIPWEQALALVCEVHHLTILKTPDRWIVQPAE